MYPSVMSAQAMALESEVNETRNEKHILGRSGRSVGCANGHSVDLRCKGPSSGLTCAAIARSSFESSESTLGNGHHKGAGVRRC
jgi:hypothetical protein